MKQLSNTVFNHLNILLTVISDLAYSIFKRIPVHSYTTSLKQSGAILISLFIAIFVSMLYCSFSKKVQSAPFVY